METLARSDASKRKRKVQDEASDSAGRQSRILQELQQFDVNIGTSGKVENVKPAAATSKSKAKARSKSPEKEDVKAKPTKTPKAPAKKAVKTAATKRAEEEAQKRDFESTQMRVKRLTDKVTADKEAAEKAAQEAKEKARREKEKNMKRVKEPSPVQQDTSTSDESDDEEPLMAKRKKAKPADWDFRIAAVDLTDGKEVIDDESISTTVSVDRYSSDHDVDNEEEMSSLHYNRVNQAEEKDSNTNLSKREALKKREKILEVFDLCSDDEDVRAVQEHEDDIHDNASMDVVSYQDDFTSEHYMYDSFYADQGEDMAIDWHQENFVQNDYQEEVIRENDAEDTTLAVEELKLLRTEAKELSQKAKTPTRSEEEEQPLFQAPPSSLSTVLFKRNRLLPTEDEPEDFDPDYLEKLLNEYD